MRVCLDQSIANKLAEVFELSISNETDLQEL